MPSQISIDCLLAVARMRSFTKAAEMLYMTRQAVSRQIALLEKELGAQLFVRTTATVEITDVGEIYVDYFRDLQTRWENVRRKVKTLQSASGETITVGCLRWADLGNPILEVVNRLKEEGHPVRVEWIRSEPYQMIRMLNSGKIDIAFTFERDVEEAQWDGLLSSFEFVNSRAMLAVSARHPRVQQGAKARDFEQETCLLTEDMMSPTMDKNFFVEEWQRFGISFSEIEFASDRESLQSMVEMGQGVTICTSVDRISKEPGIATYPINRTRSILCVWRKEEPREIVRRFAETAWQICAEKSH